MCMLCYLIYSFCICLCKTCIMLKFCQQTNMKVWMMLTWLIVLMLSAENSLLSWQWVRLVIAVATLWFLSLMNDMLCVLSYTITCPCYISSLLCNAENSLLSCQWVALVIATVETSFYLALIYLFSFPIFSETCFLLLKRGEGQLPWMAMFIHLQNRPMSKYEHMCSWP